jgi:hypothetical protein
MRYQRSGNPVPPMEWDDYIKRANHGWKTILDSSPNNEEPIQHFLEENPSIIPGAPGMIHRTISLRFTSNNNPVTCA